MSNRKLKILLVCEQCNPTFSSVPLEGYQVFEHLSKLVDLTLVTHERNKEALEKVRNGRNIVYIEESKTIKQYYKLAAKLSTFKNRTIWPIHHTLTYPVYEEFNNIVYNQFKQPILQGEYDLVHFFTPMMPRYPLKLIKVCKNTPVVIGPVNGGVPYPKGLQEVAKQEFSDFNFLRSVGRFIIPGYRETYEKANYIFAGSTYTLNLVKELFNIEDECLELLYENGLTESFFKYPESKEKAKDQNGEKQTIKLLFVGRLVPYKGADMVIEAICKLNQSVQEKVLLTIVGDGSERQKLEEQIRQLNLESKVLFSGWIPQEQTVDYYRNADIFCFPSVREFGGAVVLEAFANGLPAIVVNNGGIGEYVTEQTGFKIEANSREFIVEKLKEHIETLVENPSLREAMSVNAVKRAQEFTWTAKAQRMVEVYEQLVK